MDELSDFDALPGIGAPDHEQMQQDLLRAVAELRAMIEREEEVRRALPPLHEQAA